MTDTPSVTDHVPLSNVLSALSTLIGYIGTEVATADPFDRMLWPCRAYSNFSWQNAWKAAIFMPLGGPLHKTALETMDTFFKHGLFQGEFCGHMLGTAFFPDTHMTYRLYGDGLFQREASVRNGMLVRVLDRMSSSAVKRIAKDREEASSGEEALSTAEMKTRRQIITVSYLQLSVENQNDTRHITSDRIVESDVGPVTPKILLAIVTTEATAIGVAIAIAIIWKSPFLIMWLIPLILKITCAFFTLPREDITIPKKEPQAERAASSKETEAINSPNVIHSTRTIKNVLVQTKQGFQVISGPEDIVLQFFRHYGHPRRCRWREVIEIATIAALGLNFPVGLVVSLIWMPVSLQCVWTVYVLYVTVVMYISRYVNGDWWATTEERLVGQLTRAEESADRTQVMLKAENGFSLIARLTRTVHDSHSSAKAHAINIATSLPGDATSDSEKDAQRQDSGISNGGD